MLLVPAVPPQSFASTAGLGLVVVREMAIGLLMALALRAVLAGAELGGHLTGSQLMLSYGSVVDPQGGVRNNLVANLYGNIALLTFIGMNGHHALLRALAASYAAIPIGEGGIGDSLGGTVVQLLGIVFVLGVRLAAPVVVVMLLVEVGTALMARVAPSLNLMVVAPPLRVAVGLLAMAAMAPVVPSIVRAASSGVGELACARPARSGEGNVADTSTGEKTEKPSAKKLKEARQKGNVPRSADLVAALSLLAVTTVLAQFGATSLGRLQQHLAGVLRGLGDSAHVAVTPESLGLLAQYDSVLLAIIVAPLMATAAATGLAGNLVQSGWVFAPERLTPNFNKLSPANGFKRFAPSQAGVTVLKAIIAVTIVGLGAVVARPGGARRHAPPGLDVARGRRRRSLDLGVALLMRGRLALLCLAGADVGWQWWRHYQSLKMTKQELRDEAKSSDGNPEIKARVRRIQRDMTRRRMLAAVQTATVVITNPTHYAVALEYRRGVDVGAAGRGQGPGPAGRAHQGDRARARRADRREQAARPGPLQGRRGGRLDSRRSLRRGRRSARLSRPPPAVDVLSAPWPPPVPATPRTCSCRSPSWRSSC